MLRSVRFKKSLRFQRRKKGEKKKRRNFFLESVVFKKTPQFVLQPSVHGQLELLVYYIIEIKRSCETRVVDIVYNNS